VKDEQAGAKGLAQSEARPPTQFEFYASFVRGRLPTAEHDHRGLTSRVTLSQFKHMLIAAVAAALPSSSHQEPAAGAEPWAVHSADSAGGREALEIALTSELIALEHCADGVLLLRHTALADRLRVHVFSVLAGVAVEGGAPWLLLLKLASSELGEGHEWLSLDALLDRMCVPAEPDEGGGYFLVAKRPLN
jgi:hypothetical protein